MLKRSKKKPLWGTRIGIYPGQYFDSETGLHYNYYRYYDPKTGRCLAPDPIGLAGGINLFAYCLNDPVNGADPTGLWSISLEGYYGFGGGFVFGENPSGGFFLSFRYGYGIGGGLSYNPKGTSPGWACREHGLLNAGTGVYGGANVGLGPAYVGISGNAGVNVENPTGIFPYYDAGIEYGLDWGWSLRAGAAVGGEITFY